MLGVTERILLGLAGIAFLGMVVGFTLMYFNQVSLGTDVSVAAVACLVIGAGTVFLVAAVRGDL